MTDTGQFRLNVFRGCHIAVFKGAEIKLYAAPPAPFQRHLVDGDRPRAAIHGRVVVIGCIKMGAIVGRQGNTFDGPAFAPRQIIDRYAGKEPQQLLRRFLMVHIVDLRAEPRRVCVVGVFQRASEVDQFHGMFLQRPRRPVAIGG